jgi:hypothetical protein
MSNKSKAILWLLWGVAYFLLFAYDIENDRDYGTWLWLASAQISFLQSLRFLIKHDRE